MAVVENWGPLVAVGHGLELLLMLPSPQEELRTKHLLFFFSIMHWLSQAKLLAMLQVLRRLVQLPDQRLLPHVPVLALRQLRILYELKPAKIPSSSTAVGNPAAVLQHVFALRLALDEHSAEFAFHHYRA
ncbi:uncharacterized protein TRIVIDRAFT_221994 [Trichoderma virens Gv29-8]|uniref:Uncharacterized protein n=1 Tax=Hypocrea virens (strain Gv29-8 / FGSC 10586) TaxID=413071 RepID=G9MRK9_HYPVG|nr:uncharacterized protein TRIVIDRAFT_221994 [Trichoderma virens Gv29-8]EHK22730.1 hypothetical protein TRIVIDRAFT_221994 [Trichoderma virens Gv29-8]UKZ47781.1 hypothetical protein TrVGV298_002010 [Trichoderma virens]